MATADQLAKWIVDNQDQQDTADFKTIQAAYEDAKKSDTMAQAAPAAGSITAAPDMQATDLIAPAAAALAPAAIGQPTGAAQLLREFQQAGAVEPLREAFTGRVSNYVAKPGKAIVDVGIMMATGTPGLAPAALYDTYKGVQAAMPSIKQGLSSGSLMTGPTGAVYPATVPLFRQLQAAAPAAAARLSEIYNTQGGNSGVRAFLNSAEGAQLRTDPKFAAAAEQYIAKVPGVLGQLGSVLKPLAMGAAKVAGPLGIGYDVYEATKFARDQELGARLAAGQAQRAPQAFQQRNPTYGAPVTPEQAQTVLQSGSPRDIAAFGGEDTLRRRMREIAAARVTGPAVPQ